MPVENPRPAFAGTAFDARQLLRSAMYASLATLDEATGTPYASLVQVATEPDATPVLLISNLARHTRNLRADPRASLLLDRRELGGDSLTTHRITVMGRAHPTVTPFGRSRFLQRHPSARQFAGFADFGFWSLRVDTAHSIAGFGRIQEIRGAEIILDLDPRARTAVTALAQAEDAMLERFVRHGATGSAGRLIDVDIEGFDVEVDGAVQRELFAVAASDPATAETAILSHFSAAQAADAAVPSSPKNH